MINHDVSNLYSVVKFQFVFTVKRIKPLRRKEEQLKDLTKSIECAIITIMLLLQHTNSILTKSFRCSLICLITKHTLSPNKLCFVGVL